MGGRGTRAQSSFDAEAVFTACAEHGVAVEINSRPERSDPPDELVELAMGLGCLFSIDSDAHAPGQLDFLQYGASGRSGSACRSTGSSTAGRGPAPGVGQRVASVTWPPRAPTPTRRPSSRCAGPASAAGRWRPTARTTRSWCSCPPGSRARRSRSGSPRCSARLEKSEKRRRPSDAALAKRAAGLSTKYLEGLADPLVVRWVENQNSRWGSCTPSDRSIRLSTRLQGMPAWVIDYVLVHELAHLIESGHTPTFWRGSTATRRPSGPRASSRGSRPPRSSASRPTRRTAPTRAPLRWPPTTSERGPAPARPSGACPGRRSAARRPATSARRSTRR